MQLKYIFTYSVTIWLLGVLDFCMLIIILLINWLLNFIDGKLNLNINHRIQESTDQWQSQSNNEIVLGENGTHILSGHLLDPKGWIPTTCQPWIIRSNGTQSMELDPMIRAWKHDTSTDHVIAMMINLTYTLSSWGGNEKLFL